MAMTRKEFTDMVAPAFHQDNLFDPRWWRFGGDAWYVCGFPVILDARLGPDEWRLVAATRGPRGGGEPGPAE